MVLEGIIGFLAGCIFTAIYCFIRNRGHNDITVEDAIERLKQNGYWVNINVKPKRGMDEND